MHRCPQCSGTVEIRHLACAACGLGLEGRFRLPRLARLSPELQELVEQLVLAGTNLKDVALRLEVSYPTLRKRLDQLIEALRRLCEEDEAETRALLEEVQHGRMRAEEAARLIKELRGGL